MDTDLLFKTPKEIAEEMGRRARDRRLAENFSRATLAARAGVSEIAVKRFESTGQGPLSTVLKIAYTLGCEGEFEALFPEKPFITIKDIIASHKVRKRGRR